MSQAQTIVVTGAAGALGEIVADRFLEAGCTVVGVDRGRDSSGVVADAGRDRLHWVDIDLSEPAEVRRGFDDIAEAVGPADAVVNCAGGFRWTRMDDASDDAIDFLIDANLRSALHVVRQVLPAMKQQNYGRIILVGSKSTLAPGAGEGPYAATKAGINALTKAVAAEVAELDITINAVLPSIIDTPANRADMADADHQKWVTRRQLADIIFGLCEPVSAPINGALIPVSGRTS